MDKKNLEIIKKSVQNSPVAPEEIEDIKKERDDLSKRNETLVGENKKLEKELNEENTFANIRQNSIKWIKCYLIFLNSISLLFFILSLTPKYSALLSAPYLRLALVITPTSATVLTVSFIIRGIFSDRSPKIKNNDLKIRTPHGQIEL